MEAPNEAKCSTDGKVCSNPECNVWKPLQEFYTKGVSSKGEIRHESICKKCKSIIGFKKRRTRKKSLSLARANRKMDIPTVEVIETEANDFIRKDFKDFLVSTAYQLIYSIGEKNEDN